MFGVGFRTPAKATQISDPEVEAGPTEAPVVTNSLAKVRRSIGEWEAGHTGSKLTPPSPRKRVAHSPAKQNATFTQTATARKPAAVPLGVDLAKPRGRVAEAKACLIKAKIQINSSRNLKAEIKAEVILAVETLYRLVKEAEAAKPSIPSPAAIADTPKMAGQNLQEALEGQNVLIRKNLDATAHMMKELKQQGELVAAAALDVGAVKDQVAHMQVCMDQHKVLDGISYAAVAATSKSADHLPSFSQAVHSVIVSSADAYDTSEDVLNKIRTAVSARTSGIRVDRLRKAKDQKVVLGCQSREELTKITERLKADSPTLHIKEVENRDPLVILLGVLNFNTDEEVLEALKRQNRHILGSIPEQDYRVSVKFRRKARNPLENHVVLQVSPQVWRILTEEGKAHIDLQRVAVKDQSPLMMCSRCLGYGHSRKTCQESVDTCSHCAGPHLRKECPEWRTGTTPICCNCRSARLDRTDHNSFDGGCPIRKKWDTLARARVAYC